jgi:mono/diheme cytochrome c family protein
MQAACRAAQAVGASILLFVAGCDWHFRSEPLATPVPAEDIEDFSKLYGLHCAGCHGPNGNLGPAPPLNDPVFLSIVPDTELERVISDGRKGTLMPAWSREKGGPLSDKQVKILATEMRRQDDWKLLSKADAEIPEYLAPAGNGDKKTGDELFAKVCAGCHGDQGSGGKEIEGKKIGAVRDQAFLSLLSDQALRRLIITGRPDLGMPGYGPLAGRSDSFKPLTSADVSDLVELLKYWRNAPSKNAR